jgi:ferritin-like metal-binding protein YciE
MASTISEKNQKTIADYVGDMTALESHIEEALDKQRNEVKDDPTASEAVQAFHDMVKRHRDSLTALQQETGSTAGNPIKEAGSALLGKAAGVIDLIRTEGISKSLRDDYSAFSLAAISYSMLYTTADGLGDRRVAMLAGQHLKDYAGALMRINEITPGVVARELEKDGHRVRPGAVDDAREMVSRAWRTTETSL